MSAFEMDPTQKTDGDFESMGMEPEEILREEIGKAEDTESLFGVIKRGGGIQGSEDFFSPDDLILRINAVLASGDMRNLPSITSALGLRAKVGELMKK